MPGFVPPQLASLRSKPPAGDNWLHEIKYDGYRLQIHLDKGRVTIRTRTGLDWTRRFSPNFHRGDRPILNVQHWLQSNGGRDVNLHAMVARAGLEERTVGSRAGAPV